MLCLAFVFKFNFFIGVELLYNVLLVSAVNQLSIYIYPLFFRFSSHLSHHRALSRVPCAIWSVLGLLNELNDYMFFVLQFSVYDTEKYTGK